MRNLKISSLSLEVCEYLINSGTCDVQVGSGTRRVGFFVVPWNSRVPGRDLGYPSQSDTRRNFGYPN